MTIAAILLFLGLFGLAGMTFLFPMIAVTLCRTKQNFLASPSGQRSPSKIAICIPVVNEVQELRTSLESVQLSIASLLLKRTDVRIEIYVGSLTESPEIRKVTQSYRVHFVTPQQTPSVTGKWSNLKSLLYSTEEEWVVFLDVGAEWEPDFLEQLLKVIQRSGAICVAPTYQRTGAGLISCLLWWFEKKMKWVESFAGGPITVHGATVAYSRWHLVRAFRSLSACNWLNDDVVIPLMLRTYFPQCEIKYCTELHVRDHERRPLPGSQLRRRSRIVWGNIEWMRLLFPRVILRSPVAGCLALRRVFRVFWGYWVSSLVLGIGFGLSFLVTDNVETSFGLGMLLLSLMIVSILSLVGKDFLAAFLSSLRAPFRLWNWPREMREEIAWK